MYDRHLWKTLLAAGALALAAGSASASTVSCPGTGAITTDREFTLTTDPGSTCFASGLGNINGNKTGGNADPLFGLLSGAFGSGFVLIDKSDGNEGIKTDALVGELTSGLSGSWSFLLPSAGAGYVWKNVVLAFKSGEGNLDPDWAAFLLPDGVTSGSWGISGEQALSHANLYAQRSPVPVPLPAAGFLLIGAIGGLAALRRRRSA